MLWGLVGTLSHEFGHSFVAKICGCRTIGFFAQPIPGVIPEQPKKRTHAILTLAGGWIFGVLTILLFLPFVDADYAIIFLAAALAIETVLSTMGDGVGAVYVLKFGVSKTWPYFHRSVLKRHERLGKVGLSKIMVTNRKLWKKLTKKKMLPEYSIRFIDAKGIGKWVLLISLLGLASALMVAFVNWPVFGLMSWFGVKVQADFSNVFWVLVGITFISTVLERIVARKL